MYHRHHLIISSFLDRCTSFAVSAHSPHVCAVVAVFAAIPAPQAQPRKVQEAKKEQVPVTLQSTGKPRLRSKAAVSTSRPRNARKPSAGSIVSPTENTLSYRRWASSAL